jgi:hypothetical protein
VVHYVDEKDDLNLKESRKGKGKGKTGKEQKIEEISDKPASDSEPRLISSRTSSRMLFADLNIEDLE